MSATLPTAKAHARADVAPDLILGAMAPRTAERHRNVCKMPCRALRAALARDTIHRILFYRMKLRHASETLSHISQE